MRLVPEFHRELFAVAIRIKLESKGMAYGDAVRAHPYLKKAMLSRACTQQILSVPSFLALCLAFDLEPETYLKIAVKENQSVTAIDTRGTP
ncbi:MAG: hypothetical protein ACRCU5_13955 [Rhizobiaceae bacterium]